MSQSLLYESHKSIVYYQEKDGPADAVVIKVLKDKIPDQQEIIRFNNEFEITRDLRNAAVRRVYDKNKFNNFHALTLEYFHGETLGSCFLQNKRTLAEFLKVAIKIAEGLSELHINNIVHKDINKNNILVNPENGKIKIIDFGIASRVDLKVQHVGNPQKLEGTLEYISPEQTGRLNRVVDYRTDLYSLGITFYELLTGQLPFLSENPLELVHCHIAKNPESPDAFSLFFDERKPKVPKMLSAIVMKLISKNAEDRYQSSYGLKRDLEFALEEYEKHGKIIEFSLGSHDHSQKFKVSTRLYGRDKEVRILTTAFGNMTAEGYSAREIVMVTGYSGTGKSSLVDEVQYEISTKKGYFIKGKFDQLVQHIPFSALSQALTGFIDPILTEDDSVLHSWRNKILNELETQSAVLFDLIPNLKLLLGEQPPIPLLRGAEAQQRLTYVLQKFLKAIAQPDHPLVLFIDDLQWADLASLDLLKDISLNKEIANFLFIGAYRDNEVSNAHPLILLLDDIQRAGVAVRNVMVNNLQFADVQQLVADTLLCKTEEVKDLAMLFMQKTKGNAFFVSHCLKSLHEDGAFVFDFEKRKWSWDLNAISEIDVSENVVDLLTSKIKTLDQETQQMLKVAACTGNVFDLGILSVVAQREETEVAQDLWPAVHEGLIVPYGNGIFYSVETVLHGNGQAKKQFRFVHDRIQHAVYSGIPEAEKNHFHLQIGRILMKGLTPAQREERIFDIVHQYNIGIALVSNEQEKLELARMNNLAGIRAKNSGAYKTSYDLLSKGISLLSGDAWTSQYSLVLSLYTEGVETAFLLGKFDLMEKLSQKVLDNAKDVLDRVRIYDCKIQAYISQNKFPETIAAGLDILSQLGVVFPENPKGMHIGGALIKTKLSLAGKKIEDYIDLPQMTDPHKIEAMGVLQRMIPAAFMSGSNLFPLIVFKLVTISIKYGNTPLSAFGYACYAIASVGVLGELDNGYRFGNLSLKLAERYNDDALKSKVGFVYNCFVKHWKEPLRETAAPLLDAYKLGLKGGAVVDGVWAACYHLIWTYHSGGQLSVLKQKLSDFDEVFRQRDTGAHQMCSLFRQTVNNLEQEETERPFDIVGSFYDEKKMLSVHKQASDKSSVCIYFLNKIQLCYIYDQFEEAQRNLNDFKSYAEAVTGLGFVPVFNFYESLVALALAKQQPEKAGDYVKIAEKNQRKMKKWSKHAPMNYGHKYLIVEAAQCLVSGNTTNARDLFDKAIALAEKNGFVQEQAIACELLAKQFLKENNSFLAEVYMQKAAELYILWGANSKRRHLLEKFPQLLAGTSVQNSSTESMRRSKTTTSSNVNDLDLATLMKASTSISGEIVLEKLLATLMQIVIENAGAQKGVLLLKKNEELLIEAQYVLNEEEVKVLQSIPVSGEIVPLSLINYVHRTQEFVVLDEAAVAGNFINDPFVVEHKSKSVLCGPIVDKGKMIGIIYLENDITTRAFTSERLQMLKLLSGQIAVSIDNAMLYENLEMKVAERTTEIRHQKEVIELQNSELVSSIRYAKRIQGAVLPNEEVMAHVFRDSFIIFKPKDIVSGDFYWFAQRDEKLIVAAVDCTGHGVPGAFMSMIGSALLNEIVIKNEVMEPQDILTELHNGIVKSLAQGADGGSRDGMDIALCVCDTTKNQIAFAGANNPLYLVRNGALQLFPANKRPIGYYTSDPKPFTQILISVQPGDCLYLFSDGFADQFGGPKNKKYTYKRFKEQLISMHNKSLKEQKKLLLADFENWKGDTEQIDDVCLLGFRV